LVCGTGQRKETSFTSKGGGDGVWLGAVGEEEISFTLDGGGEVDWSGAGGEGPTLLTSEGGGEATAGVFREHADAIASRTTATQTFMLQDMFFIFGDPVCVTGLIAIPRCREAAAVESGCGSR